MKIIISIDDAKIEALRSSCDSAYWCELRHGANGTTMVRESSAGGSGAEPGPWVFLTQARVRLGLEVMADKAPRSFGRFMSGEFDSDTGDVWLQCAVLGEVRYG